MGQVDRREFMLAALGGTGLLGSVDWLRVGTAFAAPKHGGVTEGLRLGPSGGTGGESFYTVAPEGTRLVRVEVRAGRRIDAIQIVYRTPQGEEVAGGWYGGRGGVRQTLTLGTGNAVLAIGGKYGARVDSIFVELDREGDGFPWTVGGEGGSVEYRYAAPPGYEIVGFHGRAGAEVDAIGAVLRHRA
jgi:hypothetical protein